MVLEINNQERDQLMACIEVAVKSAQNSLQAASLLLPLAAKIQALKDDTDGKPDA